MADRTETHLTEPQIPPRLAELRVAMRKLRTSVRRYGMDRDKRLLAEAEAEAAPLEAAFQVEWDAHKTALAARPVESEPREWSTAGTDAELRGRLKHYDRQMEQPRQRTPEPGTCPRCGGPTSVGSQPCDDCSND